MKGLFVAPPWIDMILSGQKTWEIRNHPVDLREPIALIDERRDMVVGVARIVDCLGPHTYERLQSSFERHQLPPAMLRDLVKDRCANKAHAWVLDEVRALSVPVPIKRAGPGIWAFIDDASMLEPVNE